jgi:hypothetical protein
VFEDLVAEATHRASCCAQEPGRPRLESDIDWEPEGAPNVTVRAPAGHGPERIAARVTIVTVDWGCRAQETTGLPDPSDEGRRIGMSSAYDPRWTHYDEIRTRFALTGNDLEPLREGQRYLVCVWWTEGNSDTVIAREQATLTLPNLLEYEIFLGRSQFSRNALNHVWSLSIGWPFDCETDFQARTVSPPEELPAEVPAEPRLLCASRGRRIPLVTEVAAGLVSAAGPREDEGPGGQGFLLLDTPQGDADTGGPRFGGGWIPLYSPFHPGLIAEVEILWRASNDGSAPGAPTAYRNPFDDATRLTGSEDFTDPLLLEGSFVTLDTGDPVHPTATANLVTNGPVAGQVRALTDEPGCESRVAAIGSGGPPYAVPLGEVCPGAEYRLVVQLVDPATIGGDAVSVSYYAYDPGDWPVDQDASYHVWPAGGFATSGLVADLTLEAEVVGPSREVFVDQYHLVVGGTPIASDVGQTCRPLDEPATFGATGLPLRATVPITATVIVSTHPECGQDRRGHLLSINGRTDISLVALATGATTQIEIGDELPRVRLRVTGIRYRVDADPVPVGSPRAELTR